MTDIYEHLPNPCHACGRRHPSHSRTSMGEYPRKEYWCPTIQEWFHRAGWKGMKVLSIPKERTGR